MLLHCARETLPEPLQARNTDLTLKTARAHFFFAFFFFFFFLGKIRFLGKRSRDLTLLKPPRTVPNTQECCCTVYGKHRLR